MVKKANTWTWAWRRKGSHTVQFTQGKEKQSNWLPPPKPLTPSQQIRLCCHVVDVLRLWKFMNVKMFMILCWVRHIFCQLNQDKEKSTSCNELGEVIQRGLLTGKAFFYFPRWIWLSVFTHFLKGMTGKRKQKKKKCQNVVPSVPKQSNR